MTTTVKAEATVTLQYHLSGDDRFIVRDRFLEGQPRVKAQRLTVIHTGSRGGLAPPGPGVTSAGEPRRYLRQIGLPTPSSILLLSIKIRDFSLGQSFVICLLKLLRISIWSLFSHSWCLFRQKVSSTAVNCRA